MNPNILLGIVEAMSITILKEKDANLTLTFSVEGEPVTTREFLEGYLAEKEAFLLKVKSIEDLDLEQRKTIALQYAEDADKNIKLLSYGYDYDKNHIANVIKKSTANGLKIERMFLEDCKFKWLAIINGKFVL